MGLQTTMYGDRLQIVLLGKTNAGKSSLINEITGQPLAIVSDTKGTTTDPVSKAMEILPVGPCLLTDTPGLDDEGELGRKRVEKTKEVLRRADVAVFVVNIAQLAEEEEFSGQLPRLEQDMLTWLEERKVPAIIVLHQADQLPVQEAEQTSDTGKISRSCCCIDKCGKEAGNRRVERSIGRCSSTESR